MSENKDIQPGTVESDDDEPLYDVKKKFIRPKVIINHSPRLGLLKSTNRKYTLRRGLEPESQIKALRAIFSCPSNREFIDSSLAAMLADAKKVARYNGLDSTLEIVEVFNHRGEPTGEMHVGKQAMPSTELSHAYLIELAISNYKKQLTRLDNAALDPETQILVENLIVQMINITLDFHYMWVAGNQRHILAGVSNLKVRGGVSSNKHKKAVALYRRLQRAHPKWRAGALHRAVSKEIGGVKCTTLATWIKLLG